MPKINEKPLLDKIDRKILHALDLDARQDISKIAKKVKLSRMIVNYRIQKMQEEGLIRSFSTFSDPAKFGLTSWKVYLKFQNLTPEAELKMLTFLQNQPEVWWIAKCRGKFDLLYSALGESFYEFNQLLEEFHSLFGEFILEETINNHLEPQYFSRGYIYPHQIVALGKPFLGKPSQEKIDEVDQAILLELGKNCRQKVTEISQKINSTAKIVSYRIKELTKRKIIVFHRLNLDLSKMGMEFYKGLVYLKNITPENFNKLREFLKQQPHLNEYVKSVGEWQLEIEAEAEGFRHFNQIIDELRLNFPTNIVRVEPLLIYEEYKSEFNFLDYYSEIKAKN